ncbi:amidase signature domain-containing protein [Pyronema omphalodes]|nr:amidase signature domain-containing protein [Pyronema omphalodes]
MPLSAEAPAFVPRSSRSNSYSSVSVQPAIPNIAEQNLDKLITDARFYRKLSFDICTPPIPSLIAKTGDVTHIPSTLLSHQEIKITEMDPLEMLKQMRSKELKCETVIKAFMRRAAVAHALTNCGTELLWDYAIARAQYLDSLTSPAGPLHGLPISLKQQTGFPSSILPSATNNGGYACWAKRLQSEIGPVTTAETLYNLGAVFYIRTTEPQTVMSLETNSTLYGRTLNPYNTELTCGGSSGGEAALIAMRGSVLGLGGDIAGSIRNPAGNCGIYGFKPTPNRVSCSGASVTTYGKDGIAGARGPMAVNRKLLELMMSSYLDTEPWTREQGLIPIPWRNVELKQKIRIGLMWDDGVVRPHPCVTRAMMYVVEQLKGVDNIEFVDWKAQGHDEAWEIAARLYFEDGGERERMAMGATGEGLNKMTEWILEHKNVGVSSVQDVWNLKTRRDAYRNTYHRLWTEAGIDAILCPYLPCAAPPHDNSKYWPYTSHWNFLEYPGVVFPTGLKVDPEVDKLREEPYIPLSDDDLVNHKLWDPEVFKGAPLSLQIVTRRFEDEKCLKVLERVEMCMGRL